MRWQVKYGTWVASVGALAMAACVRVEGEGFRCSNVGRCPGGYVCVEPERRCYRAKQPPDASVRDSAADAPDNVADAPDNVADVPAESGVDTDASATDASVAGAADVADEAIDGAPPADGSTTSAWSPTVTLTTSTQESGAAAAARLDGDFQLLWVSDGVLVTGRLATASRTLVDTTKVGGPAASVVAALRSDAFGNFLAVWTGLSTHDGVSPVMTSWSERDSWTSSASQVDTNMDPVVAVCCDRQAVIAGLHHRVEDGGELTELAVSHLIRANASRRVFGAGAPPTEPYTISAAMSSSGNAIMAWDVMESTAVFSQLNPANPDWSLAAPVDSRSGASDQQAGGARVAMNRAGDGVLVWQRDLGGSREIWTRAITRSGSFLSEIKIGETSSGNRTTLAATVDAVGRRQVAWIDEIVPGGGARIMATGNLATTADSTYVFVAAEVAAPVRDLRIVSTLATGLTLAWVAPESGGKGELFTTRMDPAKLPHPEPQAAMGDAGDSRTTLRELIASSDGTVLLVWTDGSNRVRARLRAP